MKKRFDTVTVIALMLLGIVTTALLTFIFSINYFNNGLTDEAITARRIVSIREIMDNIEQNYVGGYDEERLLDGAKSAIVTSLGDRWSHYLTPDEYAEFAAEASGNFVGIGITASLNYETGYLQINEVFPDSPAQEAGLLPFELIVSVDGEDTSGLGYDSTVSKIRGEEGTTVKLSVAPPDDIKNSRRVSVTRKSVKTETVTKEILPENIGYIKIRSFDPNTAVDFEDAIEKMMEAEVGGIIFDVRYNPGGQLPVLKSMLDRLMPEGEIIYTVDKKGAREDFVSDDSCIELPITVLVNQGSYSAAEYFAAVLQEAGLCKVVGVSTVGKGRAQTPIKLKDGSALILSTKKYFLPSGENLEGVGIIPDYVVSMSAEDTKRFYSLTHEEDVQFVKALEVTAQMIEDKRIAEEEAAKAAEEAAKAAEEAAKAAEEAAKAS